MTTPISYDLSCEAHEDHVSARVRSIALTPAIAAQFLRDARNSLLDSRKARLLLEVELAHSLSEQEAFDLMDSISGMLSGLRVALVNRDPRHHGSLLFGVDIAREAGQEYGYFTNPDDALGWLRST
jgi:hypothetical protein